MFKIYTGIDPATGKRKHTTRRGFKTIGEARTAARHMENEIEAGNSLKDIHITFKSFSELWINIYQEERGVKPGTIRIRRHEINNLLPFFKNIKMADITQEQYQTALSKLNRQFAKNTLAGIHRTGRMIFRKALEKEVIKKDPTEFAYIPKAAQTIEELDSFYELPKYMEKEDLALFLKTAKEKGLDLDFEIFVTLAYTGIRIGELCPLKETDLIKNNDGSYLLSITKTYYNPNNNIKSFKLVTPKTISSRRIIDIDNLVVNCLQSVIERNKEIKRIVGKEYLDEGFIFVNNGTNPGYPIYVKIIQQRMKRILKLANLNESLTPHSLRHTHTSLLSEAGVSLERIMERLGHSDDDITKKVYLHTTEAVRKRDAEKFSNLMNGVLDFD
ncbi:site-specific integrase [Siminovitchia terrae]|uniref:Site-specific integrase n=2 Tax=Siminovitchia terrae TaxID=1914933 RepID=A0A429X2U5_SIMTE|nr:site-specific integrase [Siminovitchia terrae]